jgi:hypothetical protein
LSCGRRSRAATSRAEDSTPRVGFFRRAAERRTPRGGARALVRQTAALGHDDNNADASVSARRYTDVRNANPRNRDTNRLHCLFIFQANQFNAGFENRLESN